MKARQGLPGECRALQGAELSAEDTMPTFLEPPLDESASTSRSRARVVVHLSWSVKQRRRVLDPLLDEPLEAFLRRKAAEVGSEVLAFGAAPDHVHLVLRLPATHPLSLVLNRLKG